MTPSEKNKNPERYRQAAQNRKARHDYTIESTLETGIVLTGTEVKSLRASQASIQEAFASPYHGQIALLNAYIPEYGAAGSHLQHEARRPRMLLMHKRERNKLLGFVQRQGMTLVPLSLYFNAKGIVKVELGLAKGKRKADKREAEKERDWKREQGRLMRDKG